MAPRPQRHGRKSARPGGTPARPSRAYLLVLFLFALSGVAGLIYEVIWARLLTLVLGTTAAAVTAVLTAFMLGLALGSYGAGRWAGSVAAPLRAYAAIELGIGAYALAFPLVIEVLAWAHVRLFHALADAPATLGLARFALAVLLLLVPTVLMGASLPLLARACITDQSLTAQRMGVLYGINTLGAAAGAYVATFFLIPAVGFAVAGWSTAALNGLVGALAWVLSRRWPPSVTVAASAPPPPPAGRWLTLAAYAVSGMAALGYEVVWTRLLVLAFGSSVYAFAVMLVSFLLGLALGGLLGGAVATRVRDPWRYAAALQVVVAASVLAGAPWFDRLPKLFLWAFELTGGEWNALTALEFLMALAIMIVPTVALGATFPVITRLLSGAHRVEQVVGEAYAVNTWGAIVGAVATAFVLVPWLGLRGSLLALAGLNTLGACLLLWQSPAAPRWRWTVPLPAAALLAVVVVLPPWDAKLLSSGAYLYADRYGEGRMERALQTQRLLHYREGATATVAVIEGRYRFLRINGKTDAGDSPDNLTERLLAHVPLLLHSRPRSVLVIGLGTGITLGSSLRHPVERVDTVEISPEVVEASGFFREANGKALDDPRVRLHVMDARTWMLATNSRYDAIISEPSNPWQTGNSNLFTLEHYQLVRRRLAEGGIACQWLPIYRMDERDFQAAIRTFLTVFPDATVWLSGSDVLLVGSARPLRVEPRALATRFREPAITRELAGVGLPEVGSLLGQFLLDADGIRGYVGDTGPLHTDDYPLLEFAAPKTLYRERAPQILTALRRLAARSSLPLERGEGTEVAGLYEAIARQRLSLRMPQAALVALELASPGTPPAELRGLRALILNQIGVALFEQGDAEGARRALEQALGLAPNLVEARVNLGLLLLRAQNGHELAEREFRSALISSPNDLRALQGLATVLTAQERWAAAEDLWRRILAADPGNRQAQEGLAAVSGRHRP